MTILRLISSAGTREGWVESGGLRSQCGENRRESTVLPNLVAGYPDSAGPSVTVGRYWKAVSDEIASSGPEIVSHLSEGSSCGPEPWMELFPRGGRRGVCVPTARGLPSFLNNGCRALCIQLMLAAMNCTSLATTTQRWMLGGIRSIQKTQSSLTINASSPDSTIRIT